MEENAQTWAADSAVGSTICREFVSLSAKTTGDAPAFVWTAPRCVCVCVCVRVWVCACVCAYMARRCARARAREFVGVCHAKLHARARTNTRALTTRAQTNTPPAAGRAAPAPQPRRRCWGSPPSSWHSRARARPLTHHNNTAAAQSTGIQRSTTPTRDESLSFVWFDLVERFIKCKRRQS